MGKGENRRMRRRLANAYVSSVISISLVLVLVGVATLLLVNAKGVSDYFKENMTVSVILKDHVEDESAMAYMDTLSQQRYILNTQYVSREVGEKELAEQLGDDFIDIFETSPIPISIDITLTAEYVSSDSLAVVEREILQSEQVAEVSYQSSLVDKLNANLNKVSLVMAVMIALLLFISFVLINNTVRLHVFDKRFIIHTMKLVGATKSFIRKPFLIKAVFQGLFSSMIAIAAMVGIMFLLRDEFIRLFEIFDPELFIMTMGVVLLSGLLICLISTFFVVNKLVRLKKDELYF